MPFDAARAKRLKPHRRLANQKHTARVEMIFPCFTWAARKHGKSDRSLASAPVSASDSSRQTEWAHTVSSTLVRSVARSNRIYCGIPGWVSSEHTHTQKPCALNCVRACVRSDSGLLYKSIFSPTTPVRPATSTL